MPRSWAFPLAGALAMIGIVLAGGAWFSFANAEIAAGAGVARYVLAADTHEVGGRWHWLIRGEHVGGALTEDSRLVPGDVIGFVDHEGQLTDARFSLPADGTDTRGQQFAVTAGGSIFRLVPVDADGIELRRGLEWTVVAAGSAVAFGGAAVLFVLGRRDAASAPPITQCPAA